MRFAWKIFFSTLLLLAVTFSIGGYFLISASFSSSLQREVNVALEENKLLRFSFETAAAGVRAGGGLSRSMARGIGQSIENSMGSGQLKIRISDASRRVLYESAGVEADSVLLDALEEGTRVYRLNQTGAQHLAHTACAAEAGGQQVYLESFYDISSVFSERAGQFATYRLLTLILLAVNGVATFLMAHWLTRPTAHLADTARRFASGALAERAQITSRDEIGMLAADFNAMAEQIEQQVQQLQDAVQRQEDFIGSFAHEIKTPLTSVIGYADMLRSKELAPQSRMMAADYIFHEGKRLESLSFKLLDLIVLQHETVALQPVQIAKLLAGVCSFAEPQLVSAGITMELQADDAVCSGEPDLLKTLLYNLIDNARKAMAQGGTVSITGCRTGSGYRITVQDTGKGIAPEELTRITEAFYMVDKARARTQGGAGLGLSICDRIARLHGGPLSFESTPGAGTAVTFMIEEVQNA